MQGLNEFIHSPCIDGPVCMIDVTDSNAVYYYHFDGLGNVVALSDTDGGIVEQKDIEYLKCISKKHNWNIVGGFDVLDEVVCSSSGLCREMSG